MEDHGVTLEVAKKIVALANKGVTSGLGTPQPGKMCIEAVVCYALGEGHNDAPSCVQHDVRDFKIDLNDTVGWLTNMSRGRGLKRLGLAQLGSEGVINGREFNAEVLRLILCKYVPQDLLRGTPSADAVRIAMALKRNPSPRQINALRREMDNHGFLPRGYYDIQVIEHCLHDLSKTQCDALLASIAEDVVQILKRLGSPGCKYLYLAPLKKVRKV